MKTIEGQKLFAQIRYINEVHILGHKYILQNILLCKPDPESHRLFGKNYKKTFKTVPLQQPYLMPLDVQLESTSATRKLRDFGVYRQVYLFGHSWFSLLIRYKVITCLDPLF